MKLLSTLLLAISSAQAAPNDSHCSREEKTVFSCTVGKKIVSVCASKDLSPVAGYMQYRFGKKGKPELSIPALSQHPLKHVQADAYQAASGQTGSMTFSHGQYSYTLVWSESRTDNAPDGSSMWVNEAGLTIARKGKVIADLPCSLAEGGVLAADAYYLHKQVGYPEN